MTELIVIADPEALAAATAREIAQRLRLAVSERAVAHLALSGGKTPERAYELLAEHVDDWRGVEVWFVDERCVGPEDPESNYRMARETLLARVPLDGARVHRMEGELGPERGASAYAQLMRAWIEPDATGCPVLDVALLGIGPDGHVASLFPDSATLEPAPGTICQGVEDSPKPPPERITMSLAVLRAARACLLLVAGSEKAQALAKALGEPTEHVPASLLERERLTVLSDARAAPR